MMKIAKSAIAPSTDPWIDHNRRFFFRAKLVSVVGFISFACFLTAVSPSKAGEPAFITAPPAISPVTTSPQAQGPLNPSVNLNQTAMSGIVNQLNQRQVQLSNAAADTATPRFLFLPRTFTTRGAK